MMWYPIHAINLNLLQVKGRSDLFLKLEIIKKVIAVIVLCITIPMGLVVMCIGQICTSLIALIINTYYTGKLINIGYIKQMRDLMPTLLLSLSMWVIVYYSISFIPGTLYKLLAGILIGIIYYSSLAFLFRLPEVDEIKSIIRRK